MLSSLRCLFVEAAALSGERNPLADNPFLTAKYLKYTQEGFFAQFLTQYLSLVSFQK